MHAKSHSDICLNALSHSLTYSLTLSLSRSLIFSVSLTHICSLTNSLSLLSLYHSSSHSSLKLSHSPYLYSLTHSLALITHLLTHSPTPSLTHPHPLTLALCSITHYRHINLIEREHCIKKKKAKDEMILFIELLKYYYSEWKFALKWGREEWFDLSQK